MESCDTFVVLADMTSSGDVIFGKNSDRPLGEVQEVVQIPARTHQTGSKVKCTYLEIPQVEATLEVVLSKPAWLWGAEMGANSNGVAIGNEAVWNRLSDPDYDSVPRLLGMDLLRLALERGKTAKEALKVITDLLEKHGQGGPCSDIVPEHTYHNAFLIADPHEAWVLETARTFWVAQRITSGVRNISNCMSIGTKIDLMSNGLKEKAKHEAWWDGTSDFNWIDVIGQAKVLPRTKLASPQERYSSGKKLLETFSEGGAFKPTSMMEVLRDIPSCICRPYYVKEGEILQGNPTTGSMVSQLSQDSSKRRHWLTSTPDPSRSIFKPFQFSIEDNFELSTSPLSFPLSAKDPSDRMHSLWKVHGEVNSATTMNELRREQEALEKQLMESPCGTINFAKAGQKELELYVQLLAKSK